MNPEENGNDCTLTLNNVEMTMYAFSVSMLTLATDRTHKTWNTATCQDVLHSVFKTYGLMSKHARLNLVTSPNEKDYCIARFIANAIRPFQIRWHGRLFRNTKSFGDIELYTVARLWMPRWRRRQFRADFIELQTKFFEFIQAIDPMFPIEIYFGDEKW